MQNDQISRIPRGRSKQLSFRVNVKLAAEIVNAANVEELATADFVRKVVRIGLREHEAVGSLHVIRERANKKFPQDCGGTYTRSRPIPRHP